MRNKSAAPVKPKCMLAAQFATMRPLATNPVRSHRARRITMKKSLGIFALAFVIIAPALTQAADAAQASARSKKHRLEPAYVSSIIKDETGTPVIMQGLERPKRAIGNRHHTNKEARRRVSIPRGSAYFILPVSSVGGLPQTPLMGPPLGVAPYSPPAINSPSDRVMQSNQSFQLNRGLGNNPTNRDAYVRYHVNN
jgi:hypothetical protein